MIVNRTAYNEKDMEILYRTSKKSKAFIVRTVISLLVDAFSVFWGIKCFLLYREFEGRGFPFWFPLMTAVLFLLPVLTVISMLTRRKRAAKAMMKQVRQLGADREITFGEEGAVSVSSARGIDTTSRFSYDIMKTFYTDEDGVYIMMKRGEQDVFMAVHDDGYAEGSREELISLLESRGAERKSL